MPILGFNIGKEAALDLVHPTQGVIRFGLVTSFTSKPIRNRLQSAPITNGGKNIYRVTYHGWEGTFDLDRSDGVLDALVNLLETSFFAGNPETYFMLTQQITNPDQSQDQYRYLNVVLEPDDVGTFRGEEKVTQRFGFVAQQRIRA